MSTELVDTIERAAGVLEDVGQPLKSILEAESVDQARALASIGEEHAAMRASWLRDVLASEEMKVGLTESAE